ncbi:ankyrin repeat and LEM domain-containing protein 2 homolog [Panulirus ornatus]|uniref:ankyrin repeat and LEM domain-containing protein 2 homolog n=1 Tax=Panulirus ornatus TaxID=150431 RepID=UPI003A858D1B
MDKVGVGIGVSKGSLRVFPEEDANSLTSSTDSKSEAHIFFGVYLPEAIDLTNEPSCQKVYTDKTACLAVMKKCRGSRFKAFGTYKEALQFAEVGPSMPQGISVEEDGGASCSISGEKPSPFRGPKSQDLVKFRRSIEKGDMEFFTQCIDENPRYLVSSGDTPAILQEGFRYNALHVACRTSRPKFAAKVLATVAQAEFFHKLYPDDTLECSERRSAFLLDLYLNTPDKGLNETPLHFASKHGSAECVRVLTSYPACDKSRNNKFDQLPVDIVCTRLNGSSSKLEHEICDLLGEQCYVPVLRDDDHCLLPQVGSPWSSKRDSLISPITQDQLLLNSHGSISPVDPISPSLKVRGYAGPMSPTQAEVFHRLWRNTVAPSPAKGRKASLRLTDQEKGLERLGRELAANKGFGWNEYWNFLGDFTNFTTDEGLLKLEDYLRKKYKQLMMDQDALDASDLANRLDEEKASEYIKETDHRVQGDCIHGELNVSDVSKSSISTLSDLCQELEALRLNASLSPQFDTVHGDTVSASSKYLETQRLREVNLENKKGEVTGREEEQEAAAQLLSYIRRSIDVAAHRLAEVLGDLAQDLQSSTLAYFSVTETVRTKLKPEIVCLKNVISKCCSKEQQNEMDFGFIHIHLASKATEYIQQNLMPSDICVLAETLKMFVCNLDFVQLNSSDEEGAAKPNVVNEEKQNVAEHCNCILQFLEKALNIAYNNISSDISITDSENNMTLSLMKLDECNCLWEIHMGEGSRGTEIFRNTPVDTTKYRKAFNFLQQSVFSNSKKDVKGCNPYESSIVKRLSFTEDEEALTATMKAGMNVSTNAVKSLQNKVNDKEARVSPLHTDRITEQDGDDDDDSFATAASSVEDFMVTPEEGLKIFITGMEASKVDGDVLAAIGGREIDEKKYPHVFQWHHLISLYSEAQRDSWPSPYSYRARHSSASSNTPTKISHPNTPELHHNSRISSSTSRILFSKTSGPQDASPL